MRILSMNRVARGWGVIRIGGAIIGAFIVFLCVSASLREKSLRRFSA
jgi:hypothetical protein